MWNGRPQLPPPWDELWLRLQLLPDDFFEPLELIQTQESALPSRSLHEHFAPSRKALCRESLINSIAQPFGIIVQIWAVAN